MLPMNRLRSVNSLLQGPQEGQEHFDKHQKHHPYSIAEVGPLNCFVQPIIEVESKHMNTCMSRNDRLYLTFRTLSFVFIIYGLITGAPQERG